MLTLFITALKGITGANSAALLDGQCLQLSGVMETPLHLSAEPLLEFVSVLATRLRLSFLCLKFSLAWLHLAWIVLQGLRPLCIPACARGVLL